jgi:hypothetical protein
LKLDESDAIFFEGPGAFREWLEANHASATEVFVGYFKKATGRQAMTWSQCRGPGALLRLDRRRDVAHRRRAAHAALHASQAWQQLEHVNVAKVAKLEEAGLMRPAGPAAFEARSEKRSGIGAIYRRTATHWVVSA